MLLLFFSTTLIISSHVTWGRCLSQLQTEADWNGVLVPHKRIATWEEAFQVCKTKGSKLASPVTAELLQRMTSIIGFNNHQTPYFLGLKAFSHLGPFVSVEGIYLDEMPSEVSDMVDAIDPFLGDCLIMDHTSIRVTSCLTRLPYMCYSNETLKPCEDNGYTLNIETGSYYKFHSEEVLWDEAKAICVAEDGYLAIPNDEKEAQVIHNMAFEGRKDLFYVWVGIRDRANTGACRDIGDRSTGTWMSVNGEPLQSIFSRWAPAVLDCSCACFHHSPPIELSRLPCDGTSKYRDRNVFICEKNP